MFPQVHVCTLTEPRLLRRFLATIDSMPPSDAQTGTPTVFEAIEDQGEANRPAKTTAVQV